MTTDAKWNGRFYIVLGQAEAGPQITTSQAMVLNNTA